MLSSNDYVTINKVLEDLYALQDLDGFTATATRSLPPPLVGSELTSYNEVNSKRGA